MSADELVTYLTWGVFLLLFALALRNAVRQPSRTNVDLALLFGAPAAIIAIGLAAGFGLVRPGPLANAINTSLLLAIAYCMLRLVNDFMGVPGWLLRLAGLLFAALSLGAFAFPPPRPAWLTAGQVVLFVGLQLYAAAAFVRSAMRTSGVTSRRSRAIAIGSLLLGLTIITIMLRPFAPWWQQVSELCALGAGLSYFLGFAPPLRLRRSWQEPELRAFLTTANQLTRISDGEQVQRLLEAGVAQALGASEAHIGRYDEARQLLRFTQGDQEQLIAPGAATAIGRAFLLQRPDHAMLGAHGAQAGDSEVATRPYAVVLAAPIITTGQSLGVLAVYAANPPIVATEDLDLLVLLAGQVGAVLEMRELIDALAQARARSEVARLKDDFLSAAAHDLKTPLTTVVGQTQRLERRMRGDPQAGPYLPSIQLVAQEAQRLRHVVMELLDAARAERGQIIGEREPVDLVALVHTVAARYNSPRHRCMVAGESTLSGEYDGMRIEQLLEHLLDNAVLYSPHGGAIKIVVAREQASAHLSIKDEGIGIAPGDIPFLFERFYRGSNVDDRQYAGMGLSLFICRAIAEQHGGRIWVESKLNEGSTFYVRLPLQVQRDADVAA